jgi:hypothetical protein
VRPPGAAQNRGSYFSRACTIHLRVRADLVGLARVMRLLRRHAVVAVQVAFERLSDHEVAVARGAMTSRGRASSLAAALARAPEVLHLAIVDETMVIAEFSRAASAAAERDAA